MKKWVLVSLSLQSTRSVPKAFSFSLHFSPLQREGEVLLKNYHVLLKTTFISIFHPKKIFARVHTLSDIWRFMSGGNLWPTRYSRKTSFFVLNWFEIVYRYHLDFTTRSIWITVLCASHSNLWDSYSFRQDFPAKNKLWNIYFLKMP